MSQTISRMYDSHEKALAAVAELKDYEFRDEDIHVVGPQNGDSVAALAAAMMRGHVLKYHAGIYAQKVHAGCTLVTVHAPFGMGAAALQTLDAHGPVDSGVPDAEIERIEWDEAAPFSSALQLRVLGGSPTPISDMWNVPPLASSDCYFSRCFGMPLLTGRGGTVSEAFGMPLLSDNPAPLSSLFKLPVLKRSKH